MINDKKYSIEKEYIVMFKKYYPQQDHFKILESLFKSIDIDWSIIKRDNPSSIYPSDFALISISLSPEEIKKDSYSSSSSSSSSFSSSSFYSLCSKEKGIFNDYCDGLFQPIIDKLNNNNIIKNIFPDKKIIGLDTLDVEKKQSRSRVQFKFNDNGLDDEDEKEKEISGLDSISPTIFRIPYGRIHDTIPDIITPSIQSSSLMRQLHAPMDRVSSASMLAADALWENGFTGNKTKVAIFDTGINRHSDYPFNRVVMETDWTGKKSTNDYLGHGTFVAGIIASNLAECPGLAQDSLLHIYKVFSDEKESFTSWFLDAFNHAIRTNIDVLNLSIGGKDYMDKPFVEKIRELTANRIIVVSAMGNDGPLYGTLSNPADQSDVIGVGSINFNGVISDFSSRGMTTWELPEGYGRVKPDIVTYGNSIYGLKYDRCQAVLYGTSLSAPVVTGAISLLLSSVSEEDRVHINPALIKQVLLESAEPTKGANMFEQGRGALNLLGAFKRLGQLLDDLKRNPMANKLLLHPNRINYEECPYFWPYCIQPLYYSAIPTIFNLTLLNGMDVYGKIVQVLWVPSINVDVLEVQFSYQEEVYPYSGHVGVHVSVVKGAQLFGGMVSGDIIIGVESRGYVANVTLPVNIRVIPTPPRHTRILWDQFHSIKYPHGYFPVDEIDMVPKVKTFDWDGDHPHTNFKKLYETLKRHNYHIEVLGSPLTCFDAKHYGTLMIVDPEEEFHPVEIKKIEEDVKSHGLNLLVVGDWHNVDVLNKIQFHDKKSNRHWIPVTGGSNIPAINDLLSNFGIYFGDSIYDGEFTINGNTSYYSSGTSIVGFPQGGQIIQVQLTDQTRQILNGRTSQPTIPILGFYQPNNIINESSFEINFDSQSLSNDELLYNNAPPIMIGKVVVFGDSNCMDESTHCFGESNDCGTSKKNCFWLIENVLEILTKGVMVDQHFPEAITLTKPLIPSFNPSTKKVDIPLRPLNGGIQNYSRVTDDDAYFSPPFQQCFNQLYQSEKYKWSNEQRYSNISWNQRHQIIPIIQQPPSSTSITSNESVDLGSQYFIPYIFVIIALLLLIIHFFRKKPQINKSELNV